ncbi:50S ribosomal protein L6 [Candidatus Marinamargulisbacteria bacterium SCGC AG-333-B06]|nr:50S ribosomal protein L6 [Candidatus Marinamargulisbacteria bacterium SCGC AG-333-B06]
MSRIGNKPIMLKEADITINEQCITIEGKKGKIDLVLLNHLDLNIENNIVNVVRKNDLKQTRAFQGLMRSLIYNAVFGVTEGYQYKMFLQGIGYRVQKKGNNLEFSLGYSHPVVFNAPDGIEFKVEGQDKFSVSGIDKQLIGQVCSEIKRLRKKDSYKGKGIFYEGEVIRKKQGKSVK